MKSVYQLIALKRDGKILSNEEIKYLVEGYTDNKIPDYQFSSFLMACFINGLNDAETSALTTVMLNSGKRVKITGLDRPLIDKHSTGGVGDKLSLIISPLLANCRIAVGMFSGRGLGHSGGTLDKLESIPGMKVFHSEKTFTALLKKHHFAITGQTENIAPADKKIYALRDACGTVESIPLIVASIMSKKLALKSDGIVFDVKTGSGAFMKTQRDSQKLAKTLLAVAQSSNLPAKALITDMNQPTGRMIGNFLEVMESVEVLQGAGPEDTIKLSIELAAEMLIIAGLEKNRANARKLLSAELKSGRAYETFCRYVQSCGGDWQVLEHPERVLKGVYKRIVKSTQAGYISAMNCTELGFLAGKLGASRKSIKDKPDNAAGIEMLVKIGDQVQAGDPLAYLYSNKQSALKQAVQYFPELIEIGEKQIKNKRLIYKRL